MLAAIFVARPRFAIVIALLTTIAGAVALSVIPISQYPDIVPPQVEVTTFYPGASAQVVETTVAQPIEAQIVGVENLLYMKSVSGSDGSYSLLLSFELGTNPDINAVNVNNRLQTAMSKLPQDVRNQGVTVRKKSSALLGVVSLYSPKQTHDELFISNYATINLVDTIRSTNGVGDAKLFGPQDFEPAKDFSHCICPAGKRLYRNGHHHDLNGLEAVKFTGAQRDCLNCRLREQCLRKPQRTKVRQVAIFTGRTPGKPETAAQRMQRHVDSELGRLRIGQRFAIVEPVFGNLRYNKGLDRFTLRGRKKVEGQWKLYCLVHNIEKLAKCGYAR